jgi:hypothetical protein
MKWFKNLFSSKEENKSENLLDTTALSQKTTKCSNCGGTHLDKVSFQELNKHLKGNILFCSNCRRAFIETGVILEDGKTYASLQSIANKSHNPLAAIFSEPEPPRTNHYRCVLGRKFHSPDGIIFLKETVWDILHHNVRKLGKVTEQLSLEIDGYSNDSREIWQIPEICDFFFKVHDEVPAIEFWMTKETLNRFLYAAAAGMPKDLRQKMLEMYCSIKKKDNPNFKVPTEKAS